MSRRRKKPSPLAAPSLSEREAEWTAIFMVARDAEIEGRWDDAMQLRAEAAGLQQAARVALAITARDLDLEGRNTDAIRLRASVAALTSAGFRAEDPRSGVSHLLHGMSRGLLTVANDGPDTDLDVEAILGVGRGRAFGWNRVPLHPGMVHTVGIARLAGGRHAAWSMDVPEVIPRFLIPLSSDRPVSGAVGVTWGISSIAPYSGRIRRLILRGDADRWIVRDFLVGGMSHIPLLEGIPGGVFGPSSMGSFFSILVQAGMVLTLRVTYVGQAPEGEVFQGALLCDPIDGPVDPAGCVTIVDTAGQALACLVDVDRDLMQWSWR